MKDLKNPFVQLAKLFIRVFASLAIAIS